MLPTEGLNLEGYTCFVTLDDTQRDYIIRLCKGKRTSTRVIDVDFIRGSTINSLQEELKTIIETMKQELNKEVL